MSVKKKIIVEVDEDKHAKFKSICCKDKTNITKVFNDFVSMIIKKKTVLKTVAEKI